ncbi:MAG: DUF4397 domain-containing protein [Salinivenus sp.]
MRNAFTFLVGLLLAVGLVACDSNGGGDDPTAQVRFMHASADAGAVDVLVDGEVVASDVTFSGETASPTISEYLNVPVTAESEIEVQDADGNEVFTTTAGAANLEEDAQYTVIVAGALAAGDDTPQPIVLRDRFETDLGDDEVGIRLVHGSAGAGAVDIYLTPPGEDLQNADPLISDFQFTDSFPDGFAGQFAPQEVSQDGSELSVTPAGEKEPVVLQLQVGGDEGLPVQAGQYITGIAIDQPENDPQVDALVQVDAPIE